MKLWEKEAATAEEVMAFTVGRDPEMDRLLAPYDVAGSMAHAIMLGASGIIEKHEAKVLVETLSQLFSETREPGFKLDPGMEDIHTQLESRLVDALGETGKKIHTARSRNDQVLTAILLMIRESWTRVLNGTTRVIGALLDKAEAHEKSLIPGYTHMQAAMPSSVALWLGSHAEALIGDLELGASLCRAINKNPLGSAAGYGTSFPIDRDITTRLLHFEELLISAPSAQLHRGKWETHTAYGWSAIASSLSGLASDMILYLNQNFDFISLPDAWTTGSSIMPHKKNPDVLELIRAHSNRLLWLPSTIQGLSVNLTSGYHRDYQLTKELLFPALETLVSSLSMMEQMIGKMEIRENILDDPMYDHLFSVEEVNRKVMSGKSFRDAYREVAREIEEGRFRSGPDLRYTHTGSIGHPGILELRDRLNRVKEQFTCPGIEEIVHNMEKYYPPS